MFQLALIQTNHVIDKLKEVHNHLTFEIVSMNTTGDNILDKALPKIGEKSLFTKELEIALENQSVDFIVHSLKDLPTELPSGLSLGAILEREDPRDALILNKKWSGKTLATLPSGSVIGTSSLRRSAQLARNYPQLKVENIRGNLNTRLKKLDEGNVFDGIILAVAGIVRMKWKDRISEYLEPTSMMYAVGQGALAVECRDNDHFILSLLEPLHHQATVLRIIAERAFLNTLGGGCSAPVAVFSEYKPGSLSMTGAVWSLDGRETLQDAMERSLDGEENEVDGGQEVGSGEPARKSVHHDASTYFGIHPGFFKTGHLQCARHLGMSLAHELMDRGAIKIMSTAKQTINPKP
ncbi:porphobilinogen deaminase isoform X2 [Diaphorina citri]|uniref:hydroxymethylbilane synthase n=2 Tax=Diaphorina citri TaxID=121845 RepID=A0A1S3D3D3_DIACI|nr:porphobilinogen deaminase isoform X2 [Diaphorina citri]